MEKFGSICRPKIRVIQPLSTKDTRMYWCRFNIDNKSSFGIVKDSPLLVINNLAKLRPLGVVSLKRNVRLPDVQAISEVLPGFEITGWVGAFLQSGASQDVVQRLHTELVKAIKSPEFKSKLDELMLEPGGNSTEDFTQYIKTMSDKVGRVIQDAKIKAE